MIPKTQINPGRVINIMIIIKKNPSCIKSWKLKWNEEKRERERERLL